MKSKFVFESSDFEGSGQMVVRQSSPLGTTNISFMASVSYKIGWKSQPHSPNTALKISLTDGMCREFESLEKLCENLNNDECGYRPMTVEEIRAVMGYVGNRF